MQICTVLTRAAQVRSVLHEPLLEVPAPPAELEGLTFEGMCELQRATSSSSEFDVATHALRMQQTLSDLGFTVLA